MKIWLLLALFFSLHGRENPFFPADELGNIPVTSNKITSYPPLKRAAITLPDQARVLQEVTIKYKNLDGSVESKSIQVEHAVDWHIPLFISQSYSSDSEKKSTVNTTKKSSKKRETIPFNFIDLKFSELSVDAVTKDSLLRHFIMVNPHRIVLDFKRDANFLSYAKDVKTIPFKNVRIGNHDGYYRVVISLDGRYRYSVTPKENRYQITLR